MRPSRSPFTFAGMDGRCAPRGHPLTLAGMTGRCAPRVPPLIFAGMTHGRVPSRYPSHIRGNDGRRAPSRYPLTLSGMTDDAPLALPSHIRGNGGQCGPSGCLLTFAGSDGRRRPSRFPPSHSREWRTTRPSRSLLTFAQLPAICNEQLTRFLAQFFQAAVAPELRSGAGVVGVVRLSYTLNCVVGDYASSGQSSICTVTSLPGST